MVSRDEYSQNFKNSYREAIKNDPAYKNLSEADKKALLDELDSNPDIGTPSPDGNGPSEATQAYLKKLADYSDPENPATKERNRTRELAKIKNDIPGLHAQTILGGGSLPVTDNSILGGRG